MQIRSLPTASAVVVVRAAALLALAVPAMAAAHPPHLYEDHEYHDDPWIIVDRIPPTDPFKEIGDLVPDPNEVRLASGAPGPDYWQQQADHVIDVRIDAENHRLIGSQRVTYHNNSPHRLDYLWVQLDQNRFRRDSIGKLGENAPDLRRDQSMRWLRQQVEQLEYDGGHRVTRVADANGDPLPHAIVGTNMRLDLPEPLGPGERVEFEIDWNYDINKNTTQRSRSSWELFEDDGNAIYEIAQWFPRMCPYTDGDGWQNKEFSGWSEFALTFGDYEVSITVPETFVVTATGELRNEREVMTPAQRDRLREARTADRPIFVITPEEALSNEDRDREMAAAGERGRRTWRFSAENVRDFAFATSPKFIWDAWGVEVPGTGDVTMAMSFYPNEGEPLWSRYSTQAIAHTIEVYSEVAFPYPYPVAISVNGPVGGMEYPMICFNGPRPEEDGTYSERTKYGLIGVIIHEVGHNWFPMIINSDERQWTWMDEGMNTFVQFLAQELWQDDYPQRRGEPSSIIGYMTSERQRPIMTHGESIIQKGANAYAKPAVALNILRETVMGREHFDHAFRTYCERWAFKHPEPGDFFRTMDDASGIDLDWYWRGWFFSNEHVDVAVERIYHYTIDPADPEVRKALARADRDAQPKSRTDLANAALPKRTHEFPELLDFYDDFDELDVTPADRRSFERFMNRLDEAEVAVLERLAERPLHFTIVRFRNHGGVIMPLPLDVTYVDGEEESITLPAEFWKMNHEVASKLFVTEKPIVRVELDRHRQIADADRTNNVFPTEIIPGRFGVVKSPDRSNPMRRALAETGRADTAARAEALARALLAAWNERADGAGSDATPATMEAALLEALGGGAAAAERRRDAWNRPFSLAFADDPAVRDDPAGTVFLTISSRGADDDPGTDDDATWEIRGDGTFAEVVRGEG